MRRLWLLCVGLMTTSCAPLPPIPFVTDADLGRTGRHGPPSSRAPVKLEVGFDEPVSVDSEPRLRRVGEDDPARAEETVAQISVVRFLFEVAPSPAAEHHVEAQVADEAGNHLRFVARFYGLNPFMLPAMLINEFTTQGSGNQPGPRRAPRPHRRQPRRSVLYEGVPGNWEQRFVFPSVDVVAGDYLVVHFKPEGIADEVNETSRRDASGGLDASPRAWDFWVDGRNGVCRGTTARSRSAKTRWGLYRRGALLEPHERIGRTLPRVRERKDYGPGG